ncbi:hypothetical protein Q3G72_030122 [Acer saccharum]|nr:hypothetical protein Q3G72_030122 [Acer saccharum]
MRKMLVMVNDDDGCGMMMKMMRLWDDDEEEDVHDPATPTTEKGVYAQASAWYHVTYHHSYWGCYNQEMNRDHFLSFAWSVYDKLIDIKKGKLNSDQDLKSEDLL